MTLRYGPEICQDFTESTRREWLETNGLGGFSSSTVCGLNTRRYHGLLTAALQPPSDRKLLLSKLEETLIVDGRAYELSANHYPGAIHPHGYQYLAEFRLDPFPVFLYRVEDLELRKSVFMIQGENAVVIEYHLRAQGPQARANCRLELRPLIAFRDFHQTTHANSALNASLDEEPGCVSIQPYPDLPKLHFAHDATHVRSGSGWYYRFQFLRELERGLDFEEDLFHPFTLSFDLATQAAVIVSTGPHSLSELPALRQAGLDRRRKSPDTAASQFIVDRAGGKSIIAGYHWFGDWGRDTMISLPGLTLATGQPEVARDILTAFALVISDGMLPNRFPDRVEKPEYNTSDATLWFFEAIRAWFAVTQDRAFLDAHLLPALRQIVDCHIDGTRYGIHVEPSGLLHAGEPGVQLTWMDAKIGPWVVTPRQGKAVEIQALWYNALRIMQDLTGEDRYRDLADRAKASFAPLFWNEQTGCLFDVISGQGKDPAIRPNQLVAISLPHKILDDPHQASRILDVVERDLLTPYGLRTLSPHDPLYRGQYAGDQASRDAAYHQGTVWPWLLGPYCDACAAFRPNFHPAELLRPLEHFRDHQGCGQIPEIFDGDPPHAPRGCIAQAWSVAELLRIKSRFEVT